MRKGKEPQRTMSEELPLAAGSSAPSPLSKGGTQTGAISKVDEVTDNCNIKNVQATEQWSFPNVLLCCKISEGLTTSWLEEG